MLERLTGLRQSTQCYLEPVIIALSRATSVALYHVLAGNAVHTHDVIGEITHSGEASLANTSFYNGAQIRADHAAQTCRRLLLAPGQPTPAGLILIAVRATLGNIGVEKIGRAHV